MALVVADGGIQTAAQCHAWPVGPCSCALVCNLHRAIDIAFPWESFFFFYDGGMGQVWVPPLCCERERERNFTQRKTTRHVVTHWLLATWLKPTRVQQYYLRSKMDERNSRSDQSQQNFLSLTNSIGITSSALPILDDVLDLGV